MYDVIIIGSGPCGISTAIYLKRYGYNPIIIAKDNGALERASLIENYYGINFISGHDLALSGINQAKNLQIPIMREEVIDVSIENNFVVKTSNNSYEAKALMLAMGKSRAKNPLAQKFEGSGVSYCATCDGFFYRKKKIAIVGNGKYMLEELSVLKNLTNDILIFTDGKPLDVEVPYKTITDKIIDFKGDDSGLKEIVTKNETYEIDGCFMAIGSMQGFSIASHIGIATNNENILVNSDYMTNIKGIFAGGDLIGGLLQVSKAVSDGANAALGIKKYLMSK